jgi:uncharacterized protein (DUF305 family)
MIASTAIGRVEEVQLLKPVLPSLVKAIISVVGQQIRQMQRQLSPAADMPLHWPTAEMCQQRSSRLHALEAVHAVGAVELALLAQVHEAMIVAKAKHKLGKGKGK